MRFGILLEVEVEVDGEEEAQKIAGALVSSASCSVLGAPEVKGFCIDEPVVNCKENG